MQRISLVIFLSFLLFSKHSQAFDDLQQGSISIGGFNEKDGSRAGAEISVMGDFGEYLALRLSGVLYSGIRDVDASDTFRGFSFSGYFHLDQKHINPYVGLGIFVGETFNCTDFDEEHNDCTEDVVAAFYPELGVMFSIKAFFVYPYVRRYIDSNSEEDSVNAYGLNIGVKF